MDISMLQAANHQANDDIARAQLGLFHDLSDRINLAPHHRHVGYVPQYVALFPHMDVRRNLLYGRHPGVSPDLDRVVRMLEILRQLLLDYLKRIFQRRIARVVGLCDICFDVVG